MKKCYKHNIVKTKLDKCFYIDTDIRMLHAIMELVTDFVNNDMRKWSLKKYEKECTRIKKEDGEYAGENLKKMKLQYETDQKLILIAKWWKNYNNRNKEIDRARHAWTSYYEKFLDDKTEFLGFQKARDVMSYEQKHKEHALFMRIHTLKTNLYEDEQKMLKLAVDARIGMWS